MNEQIYNASVDSRERGERLRRIRNLANLSRKSLCDGANININTYIGYEVGKYGGLPKKSAEVILAYLSTKGVYCSFDWLMTGEGKGPYTIVDTPSVSLSVLNEEQKIYTELALFHSHYQNAVDFQIIDDGMLPLYEKGSFIAGISYFDSAIDTLIGFDCIVQTQSGERYVRNLREGRIKNTYTLTCINPRTTINSPVLYDVKLAFAAKIVWHRKFIG
jgi:transcriptional regulator with XRE-family HTH domain